MKKYERRFSDEANIHYRFPDVDMLVNDTEELEEIIDHHKEKQQPRLKELLNYYKGDNRILDPKLVRRKEDHVADRRAAHNLAKYVSQFIQGYIAGVPIATTYQDEANEDVEEQIKDLNRNNSEDEHNSDLVLDQSIYGRAYELLYRTQQDETKFVTLDPTSTFVIYDDTIERKPIAAVRYLKMKFKEDEDVYLYTDKHIYQYEVNDRREYKLVDKSNHYFGAVPINEYDNNKYRQGDFEDVLDLIDLYDAAQSDTANYMEDLNDAMLKIVGNLEIDVDDAKDMKEANLLMLRTEPSPDGKSQQPADADYIYKQYDVQGTEAYKDRLFNNILLFTSIPNLLDEEGATSQSGEALKMKLFALSQKRATKERLFKKALRHRYELINNIHSVAAEGTFDVNDLNFAFTENLPSMVEREIEWFTKAGGILSQKTLRDQLSFVENSDEEAERIEKEREEGATDPYADNFPLMNSTEEVDTDGEE